MSKAEALPFFQPKLTIGQPNDKYEKEADAVADAVVNQTSAQPVLQTKKISSIQRYMTNAEFDERGTNTERIEEDKRIQEKPEVQRKSMFESNEESPAGNVQRKCATCEKNEMVQKMEGEEEMINEKEESVQRKCASCEQEEDAIQPKAVGGGEMTASSSLQSRLNSSKGGGSALPDDTRASMESSIGADFSGVRIHTDSSAIQMNKELGAQAFTHGSDVYFNSGKYDTSGKEGQRLLGHELTHVVQQGSGVKIQRSCTPMEKAALYEKLKFFCNQDRKCNLELDSCETTKKKIAAGTGCISLRTMYQKNCFKPSDPGYQGHMGQIRDAYKTLRDCEVVYSAKCKDKNPKEKPKPLPEREKQKEDTVQERRRVIELSPMPEWAKVALNAILALLTLAAIIGIIACFATGVCEIAGLIVGLGTVAVFVIMSILEEAGISDNSDNTT